MATLFYSLQVQYPFLDLLCSALIPELRSDITAGTSCHVQGVLIGVTAVGATPYQLAVLILHQNLSVVATRLAIVALGVLEPRFLGKQLGLDPLVTLIALYAGYKIWGIGGMIIAPMLAVTASQLISAVKPDQSIS